MKLGVWLPSQGGEPEAVVALARAAEEREFDSVWVGDHVLQVSGPVLDPLIALAVVAGATRRIRLGTNVLIVPYRNPLVLANEVASLDRFAGGRVLLGVGVGWNEAEFAALGVPVRERGSRTDEALGAMRRLWGGGPASALGRFYPFAAATLGTLPATPGGPPLYVGGWSEAALRRALRVGTGWIGFEDTPEKIRELRGRLERLGPAVGRDAAELEIVTTLRLPSTTDAEPTIAALTGLREAGVGLAILDLPPPPGAILPVAPPTPEVLAWVAAEVIPHVG